MKMNSAQIERTLEQFEGEVVPEDNPVLPQLKRIFGDHPRSKWTQYRGTR